MPSARSNPYVIRLPQSLKGMLLTWVVAEVLVLMAVVHLVGFGGAVLLGLLTTVVGVIRLRRVGLDAARGLRSAATSGLPAQDGRMADGMLSALGAILLIVPGFIANFLGLALAAPSVRGWTSRRFGGLPPVERTRVRRSGPGDIIDLSPEDWKPSDR